MSLIWTRSPYYWSEDKKALEMQKIDYHYLPCLNYKVETIQPFSFNLELNNVIVFTSIFAATVASELISFEQVLKTAKIFVMGQKTQFFLQGKGLEANLLESSSAGIFAKKILKEIKCDSNIILPGSSIRAFPMKEFFEKKGFRVQQINCYQTIEKVCKESGDSLTREERVNISSNNKNILLMTSPSAVRSFVKEFFYEKNLVQKNIKAIVLGETTASFCLNLFKEVLVTSKPDLKEVLSLFKKLCRND